MLLQSRMSKCLASFQCDEDFEAIKVQSHHRNGIRTLLDNDISTLIKPSKWPHNISG